MGKEEEILDQMRVIIDPDLGKDIVSLGFIKDLTISQDNEVSFQVQLTTPACPVKDQFRQACHKAVSKLPWVKSVHVTMTAQTTRPTTQVQAPGLANVKHVVAVSSCKGGVGKSTVAVNLAYAMAEAGGRVGIFDADVYGPSLPTMVQPQEADLYQENELIIPLQHDGVKLMSFGYIPKKPGQDAAIMRGPMVSGVINQLLTGTSWGELDYLVIDMPPGTGDIQLTLAQLIPLTATVIVTTPQQLSFVDVVKGIQMFDKLKVPTIAVVENMSYFQCPNCDKHHALFGTGALKQLTELYGFKNTFQIPLYPAVSSCGDKGIPVILQPNEQSFAEVYRAIGEAIVREISKLVFGGQERPKVLFDADRGLVVTLGDGDALVLHPADVRRQCRCAHCIEEMTGKRKLQDEDISEDIYPTGIQPVGNYAVAIQWSDGHSSSIYPYEALSQMSGATKAQKI